MFVMINEFWRTGILVHEVLVKRDIDYAVIKSYANLNYTDGNIDIVVDIPRFKAAKLFGNDYRIKFKDRLKSVFYERNKLMLSPKDRTDIINIHLHNSAGWHNHDFVRAKSIFKNTKVLLVGNTGVNLVNEDIEKRIIIFHCLFEKFSISDLDRDILMQSDIDEHIRQEYNLEIEINLNNEHISRNVLRLIWRTYSKRSKNWSSWNTFLLELLLLRNRLRV